MSKRFRLAPMLRELARRGQDGHPRKPSGYFMQPGGCAYYWDNHGVVPDQATWDRVAALSSRYLRFVDYAREVAPRWTDTQQFHYADNSIEIEQFSPVLGKTRRVMTVAPGGDACF